MKDTAGRPLWCAAAVARSPLPAAEVALVIDHELDHQAAGAVALVLATVALAAATAGARASRWAHTDYTRSRAADWPGAVTWSTTIDRGQTWSLAVLPGLGTAAFRGSPAMTCALLQQLGAGLGDGTVEPHRGWTGAVQVAHMNAPPTIE